MRRPAARDAGTSAISFIGLVVPFDMSGQTNDSRARKTGNLSGEQDKDGLVEIAGPGLHYGVDFLMAARGSEPTPILDDMQRSEWKMPKSGSVVAVRSDSDINSTAG